MILVKMIMLIDNNNNDKDNDDNDGVKCDQNLIIIQMVFWVWYSRWHVTVQTWDSVNFWNTSLWQNKYKDKAQGSNAWNERCNLQCSNFIEYHQYHYQYL